ncbi:MAG TPA: hypothetical protein VK948_04040, partial [Aeromicrobium sp.]|nr:hypothetical protein [Aeromicrobium sp.]
MPNLSPAAGLRPSGDGPSNPSEQSATGEAGSLIRRLTASVISGLGEPRAVLDDHEPRTAVDPDHLEA